MTADVVSLQHLFRLKLQWKRTSPQKPPFQTTIQWEADTSCRLRKLDIREEAIEAEEAEEAAAPEASDAHASYGGLISGDFSPVEWIPGVRSGLLQNRVVLKYNTTESDNVLGQDSNLQILWCFDGNPIDLGGTWEKLEIRKNTGDYLNPESPFDPQDMWTHGP